MYRRLRCNLMSYVLFQFGFGYFAFESIIYQYLYCSSIIFLCPTVFFVRKSTKLLQFCLYILYIFTVVLYVEGFNVYML